MTDPIYIIAETAWHHQGESEFMTHLIQESIDAKCNAIKFHITLNLMQYFQKKHPLLKELETFTFSKEKWQQWIDMASAANLDVIALCNDLDSITFINEQNAEIRGVELHATSINDFPLLEECSKFNNTIFLGIGGCSFDEIHNAVDYLAEKQKTDICLMYGFQNYPTDYKNVNLNKITKIKNAFNLPVGYADHTAWDNPNNALISALAVARGCTFIEKHITHALGQERIDWHAAVGKNVIFEIRRLSYMMHQVFGSGSLAMSEAELAYGKVGPMKKAIVANKNIQKGDIFTKDNLTFKRTEKETMLAQAMYKNIIGLTCNCSIQEDEMITEEILSTLVESSGTAYTNIMEK